MKKITLIILTAIILYTSKLYSAEKSIADLQKDLNEVAKKFESLEPSTLENAVILDKSIKELNKAVEFVQQNLENENPDIALKAVSFVNKSLSDISSVIPKNYDSDLSNADMTSLGEETLKEVTNVTEGLAKKKETDTAKLISNMLDVNDVGFNVFDISKNLNSFGVDTIKMQLDVKTREEMSEWTKEDWEAAWTGGVLTDDGEQIITDKEAEQRLLELNQKLESVEQADLKRKNVQNNINNLNKELTELESKKTSSLNQIEKNKLSLEKQIELKKIEITNEQNILQSYNEKINNLDKQIENINSLTSSVNETKNDISLLKKETTNLNVEAENLNKEIQEANDRIKTLQQGIQTRQAVARNKKTIYESWEHNTITYQNRAYFDAALEKYANSTGLSIDIKNITDEDRIEYYDQYKEIFEEEKRWTNTINKRNVTDNLKLDGTASGFIERQKKVLSFKNEYEAWKNSVSIPEKGIAEKAILTQELNLQLENINNKIATTNEIISTKEANLDVLQKSITEFNLQDSRYNKITSLESEKKKVLGDIENENIKLNENLENNNKKITSSLSSINSLQSEKNLIDNRLNILNEKVIILSETKNLHTKKNRTNIQKEVEAFNNFGHILAANSDDSNIADIEIEYALKHADVILSGDAKQHQIFDLEKYGKIASLPESLINKGKNAIYNDDWNTQKQVYSNLFRSLSKKKDYTIEVPNDYELDQLIKDQKFENEIIELVRENPTNINFDANLTSIYWPKGAVAPSSLKEAVDDAYNQIIDNTDYKNQIEEFENLKKVYKEGNEWMKQANVTMGNINNEIATLRNQGKWDEANVLVNMMNKDIRSKFNKKYTEVLDAQSKIFSSTLTISRIQGEASKKANDYVWELNNQVSEQQKKAVNDLNKMIDQKLNEMPSYNSNKINSIKKMISGISPDSTTLAVDPSAELFAAKAKAILYDDDGKMLKAFNIANDTSVKSVLYDTTGTGKIRNLKNYTSDRTNVELAAEIKSTLDGTYTSDSIDGYMTAKYHQGTIIEKIERFTPKERREVGKELENLFSNKKNSPLLESIDKKIDELNNEINKVSSLNKNISTEIDNLEKEVNQITFTNNELQQKISGLSEEFKKNEQIFKNKELQLTKSLKEIDPLNFALNNLNSEKKSIQNQIEIKTIELDQKTKETGIIDVELKSAISELKSKENEFNQQIDPLKNKKVELIAEVQILTDEVNAFNKAKPEFEQKITDLENEIEMLNNTKADLATAQAKNIGLKVDEKAIKSIEKIDNTAVIALNGPALVRVVDEEMLLDQAEEFIDPISKFSVNSKIYTSAAVRPEELFAVKNLTGEIKVALSEGTVQEIGTGSLGIKIQPIDNVDKEKIVSLDTNKNIESLDSNKTIVDSETSSSIKSTSESMKSAQTQAATAKSSLNTVSKASSTLSSVSSSDMKISGDYSNNYGFDNKATAKAVEATAAATAASATSRTAATEAATAAAAAKESAKQAAAKAEAAAKQAQATAQAAAQQAARDAAEQAALQAAQAAAAQQAQQVAEAAAAVATSQAATVAAQSAATNAAIASSGVSQSQTLTKEIESTTAAYQAASAALNAAEKAAAAAPADAAAQAASAAAYTVAVAARDAKKAAESSWAATHNAISMASVTAKAAAEQAAKEAASAAAEAAKDVANEVAKEAAAAAAAAAVQSKISAIDARIAEMTSAKESWAKESNAEKLLNEADAEIQSLQKEKESLQGN